MISPPRDVLLDYLAAGDAQRFGDSARSLHEVRQLLTDDELVAARESVGGRHDGPFLGIDPTGNDLRVDQALFARIRDGRISEMWEVVDTGAGLRLRLRRWWPAPRPGWG